MCSRCIGTVPSWHSSVICIALFKKNGFIRFDYLWNESNSWSQRIRLLWTPTKRVWCMLRVQTVDMVIMYAVFSRATNVYETVTAVQSVRVLHAFPERNVTFNDCRNITFRTFISFRPIKTISTITSCRTLAGWLYWYLCDNNRLKTRTVGLQTDYYSRFRRACLARYLLQRCPADTNSENDCI